MNTKDYLYLIIFFYNNMRLASTIIGIYLLVNVMSLLIIDKKKRKEKRKTYKNDLSIIHEI